uniref:Uncharacterized protein n=1 Tax=Cacopsylla melanoneura TaxID=428564 RepID=A0A8D8VN34_9HEMI
MASRLDDSDYLSPAKRLKLDNESLLNSENVSNSSSETVIQENNSTFTPEDLPLPIINFEEVVVSNVVDVLSDLPSCSSPLPSLPPTEEQLADIVEPLGEHSQGDEDDPADVSVTSNNNDDDEEDEDEEEDEDDARSDGDGGDSE